MFNSITYNIYRIIHQIYLMVFHWGYVSKSNPLFIAKSETQSLNTNPNDRCEHLSEREGARIDKSETNPERSRGAAKKVERSRDILIVDHLFLYHLRNFSPLVLLIAKLRFEARLINSFLYCFVSKTMWCTRSAHY